ncbi:hypothetical protein Tco_0465889 [Tanacetum coccineum]
MNRVDKDKDGSSRANVDDFIKVKKKKFGGNNGGTKNIKQKIGKTNASILDNGTFSLSNSFEVLNVDNPSTEEVDSGNKATMSSVQEEGDHDSEDEVEAVDNEITSHLASEASGVGYGTNSLLE